MFDNGKATVWSDKDIVSICQFCGRWAIVELPARLKAQQPDGTTHVCHPGFGGCNHGFEIVLEQVRP